MSKQKRKEAAEEQEAAAEGEEECGPMPISKLEQHGISAVDVKKLQAAGFYTVNRSPSPPRKLFAPSRE